MRVLLFVLHLCLFPCFCFTCACALCLPQCCLLFLCSRTVALSSVVADGVCPRQSRAKGVADVSAVFDFSMARRIECAVSHCVKFDSVKERVMALPIPEDATTLEECLRAFARQSSLSDFVSPVTQVRVACSVLQCVYVLMLWRRCRPRQARSCRTASRRFRPC